MAAMLLYLPWKSYQQKLQILITEFQDQTLGGASVTSVSKFHSAANLTLFN